MDIRERTLAAFKIEYAEHLAYIRSALARLEASDSPPEEQELFEMYRRAHSLKGAARAADMAPVEAIAHEAESLFSLVKSGQLGLDAAVAGVVQEALDAIEDWVVALETDPSPPAPIGAMEAIRDFLAASGSSGSVMEKSGGAGTSGEAETHEAPPASSPAAAVPSAPPKPEPKAASPALPAEEPPLADSAPAASRRKPAQSASASAEAQGDGVKVSARKLDNLLRTASQILTESISQQTLSDRMEGLEVGLKELEGEIRRMAGSSAAGRSGGRTGPNGAGMAPGGGQANADLVEGWGRRISVLAAELGRLRGAHDHRGWVMGQLAGGLQTEIAQARMIPLESVFGGFPKMVRDLGREEGKEIEFRLSGLELEVDRAVVQIFKDPVMHILRNAVFHGIEMPGDREAAGKKRAGRIATKFSVSGNRLSIAIEDDGRGIDFGHVRTKVMEAGLATAAELSEATDDDLLSYLFQPGFSTSGRVTNIAGRGLGLSIVSEAVGRLGGSMEVTAAPEGGTRFLLDVPLSIATRRLLLVEADDVIYALPADGVESLQRVESHSLRRIEGNPAFRFRDEHLPLVSLGALMELESTAVNVQGDWINAVILRDGNVMAAVAVDEFRALRDSMVIDLGFDLPPGGYVGGGMFLEDGTVACVLNPVVLVRESRRSGRARSFATTQRAPVARRPTLLVVDDSFTTRTLEKSVLEAHGYEVHLAVDGLEATESLQRGNFDLVVSDIEMPRMDGWGLLQWIKADGGYPDLPVIVVTSREDAEDRKRGMLLGASAYIVKQQFDQRELLDTIDQLL